MSCSGGTDDNTVVVVEPPLALGLGVFGAVFTCVGMCLWAGQKRHLNVRRQLLGDVGTASAIADVTETRCETTTTNNGGSTSHYLATYSFVAGVGSDAEAGRGGSSRVVVKDQLITNTTFNDLVPPCTAPVRYLRDEPRRCVLQARRRPSSAQQ